MSMYYYPNSAHFISPNWVREQAPDEYDAFLRISRGRLSAMVQEYMWGSTWEAIADAVNDEGGNSTADEIKAAFHAIQSAVSSKTGLIIEPLFHNESELVHCEEPAVGLCWEVTNAVRMTPEALAHEASITVAYWVDAG